MNKPEEASSELERGLDVAKSSVPTALNLFILYARICERQHWSIPVRYRSLLEDVIQWYGLQISPDSLNNSTSLTPAIIAADLANREAQARYESLQRQLRDISKDVVERQRALELLRAYVDKEPVGYYRQMVLKILENISG
jgi:hypothetical protein